MADEIIDIRRANEVVLTCPQCGTVRHMPPGWEDMTPDLPNWDGKLRCQNEHKPVVMEEKKPDETTPPSNKPPPVVVFRSRWIVCDNCGCSTEVCNDWGVPDELEWDAMAQCMVCGTSHANWNADEYPSGG